MSTLPDISDLKDIVNNESIAKTAYHKAIKDAHEAKKDMVRRYKEAKVPYDLCDHPVTENLPGASLTACSYCNKTW